MQQLGLNNKKLSYKQRAFLTILERDIISKSNKYPDNLDTIIYDTIYDNRELVMKVLFLDENKTCYKRAVAINDCITVLGLECMYSFTISKDEIEKLYELSNIHYHEDVLKKIKEKLKLYEEIIEEFVSFDTTLKQDSIKRLLNHEEIKEGVFNIKLKHMTFDLIMHNDTRYHYANVRLNKNEKELIL